MQILVPPKKLNPSVTKLPRTSCFISQQTTGANAISTEATAKPASTLEDTLKRLGLEPATKVGNTSPNMKFVLQDHEGRHVRLHGLPNMYYPPLNVIVIRRIETLLDVASTGQFPTSAFRAGLTPLGMDG